MSVIVPASANIAPASANTSAPAAAIIASLREKFPQSAEKITPRASADHPAINIPAADAVAMLAHLRDAHGFDMLADLTAIDWAEGTATQPRFTVVWHLLSTGRDPGAYLRVAADCASDTEPEMPSVTTLWAVANWHERETYDLLGIRFTGHPDLRRILMWEGYPFHPLRKEFPLAGIETELDDKEVSDETQTKVRPAPMAGGPFVASSGAGGGPGLSGAEPRAKDESWNERTAKPAG